MVVPLPQEARAKIQRARLHWGKGGLEGDDHFTIGRASLNLADVIGIEQHPDPAIYEQQRHLIGRQFDFRSIGKSPEPSFVLHVPSQLNPYFEDVSITFGPTTISQAAFTSSPISHLRLPVLDLAHHPPCPPFLIFLTIFSHLPHISPPPAPISTPSPVSPQLHFLGGARPRLIVPMHPATNPPGEPPSLREGASPRERGQAWTKGWAPFPAHTTHPPPDARGFLALTTLNKNMAETKITASIVGGLQKSARERRGSISAMLKQKLDLDTAGPGHHRDNARQLIREEGLHMHIDWEQELERRQIQRDARELLRGDTPRRGHR